MKETWIYLAWPNFQQHKMFVMMFREIKRRGMTMQSPAPVVMALFSAFGGGLLAYLTVAVRIRKVLVAKYDLDLRSKRIKEHRKLWNHPRGRGVPYLLQGLIHLLTETDLVCRSQAVFLRQISLEFNGFLLSRNTLPENRRAYSVEMINARSMWLK